MLDTLGLLCLCSSLARYGKEPSKSEYKPTIKSLVNLLQNTGVVSKEGTKTWQIITGPNNAIKSKMLQKIRHGIKLAINNLEGNRRYRATGTRKP